MSPQSKYWGWGSAGQRPSEKESAATAAFLTELLKFGSPELETPVSTGSIELSTPSISTPDSLTSFCTVDTNERVTHAMGKSYADVVRGMRGDVENAPDIVAHPTTEGEIEALLEWATSNNVAVIPFGGGTSVVGGVEARGLNRYDGVVTVSLRRLNSILEIDTISNSAKVAGGALGPEIEAALKPRGLTLRHYPQSFEFSTLGGWIVTRAGGHFATKETLIDDLVESARMITPTGSWESRRLPASGAGISPDRVVLGSEGTLGIVTDAWVRVRPIPQQRAGAIVHFASFLEGAAAVRKLLQADLQPANCRLVDPIEAALMGAGDGQNAVLILGFESPGSPVDHLLEESVKLCLRHGGKREPNRNREGTAASWKDAFLRVPYLRDTLIRMGVICETFETAVMWNDFERLHKEVVGRVRARLGEICGGGTITCRLTHSYPNGTAPYFTVLAPGNRGEEIDQWAAIKQVASDTLIECGASITHHHAVGRDHRPWYDRQRPDRFAAVLRAAQSELDPAAIMNPGVLTDRTPG